MSDFEQSIISALATIFPEVLHSGCMFHWGQALWRKFVQLKLHKLLGNEIIGDSIRNVFRFIKIFWLFKNSKRRQILSLPLLPIERVRKAFAIIIKNNTHPQLTPFLVYIAENYIGFTEYEVQEGAAAFGPQFSYQKQIVTPNPTGCCINF